MQNCFVFTQVAETAESCNVNESDECDINKAVVYYHNMEFHIIPKIRDEKRPAVKWKIYQENQPPLYIVKHWK